VRQLERISDRVLIATVDAVGGEVEFEYDAVGNIMATTDELYQVRLMNWKNHYYLIF
jgi:YD repeat-containing protein